MQKQLLPGVVMSLLAAVFSGNASPQSYPAKPVRFIVPWSAMFAPAGTPPEIVRRLQREVVAAIKDPAMREQLAALGAEGIGNTPEELGAVLRSDVVKWTKIARQANLQPE